MSSSEKPQPDFRNPTQFAEHVRDSAQQIWLAGLGAFAKTQQEGSKVFDTLVKDGMSMHRKTQAVAEEKFAEATERMNQMASQFTTKAGGQWDKLENIFEGRVAKALSRLGVPTAKEIQALTARVEELSQLLAQHGKAVGTPAKAKARTSVAAKVARKTTANPRKRKAD